METLRILESLRATASADGPLRAALEEKYGPSRAEGFLRELEGFRAGKALSADASLALLRLGRKNVSPEKVFDGESAPADDAPDITASLLREQLLRAQASLALHLSPGEAVAPTIEAPSGNLAKALSRLRRAGVELDFEPQAAAKGETEADIVTSLLREQLLRQEPVELRLTENELADFGWDKAKRARQALKLFREHRYRKAWSWLWSLRKRMGMPVVEEEVELSRVYDGIQSKFVQDFVFDPESRLLIAAGQGLLAAKILPGGDPLPFFLDAEAVPVPDAVYARLGYSPEFGLLAAVDAASDLVELRRVDRARIGAPVAVFRPFKWVSDPSYRQDVPVALLFDPAARTLTVVGPHGQVEVRFLERRGDDPERIAQSFSWFDGSRVIGAALDPKSRTLLAVHENGGAIAWKAGEDGRWSQPAAWREDWHAFGQLSALAFDPASRLLAMGQENGALYLRRWREDGTVSPQAEYVQTGAFLGYGMAWDPARKALLAGGPYVARLPLPARGEPRAWPYAGTAEQKKFLSVLLELLRRSPHARDAAETLHWLRDPAWIRALWGKLEAELLTAGSRLPRLRKNKVRWHRRAREELARRMPGLPVLLESPGRRGLLVQALSLLRLLYPYNLANVAPEGALAWAKRTGIEFPLGGLKVVPVSESFRGHIIRAADEKGPLAVELKIPGENFDRTLIHPDHFDLARRIWSLRPRDPGVARPWAFASAQGELPIYGIRSFFDAQEPLGVFLRGYREGKRYSNSEAYFWETLPRLGRDPMDVHLDLLADAGAVSVLLHALGWLGSNERFNDMHPENFRVHGDGTAEWVADFGAFYKDGRRRYAARREETLRLLWYPYPGSSDILEELARRIAERLARGGGLAWKPSRLLRFARRELGLT